ncbi:MAG: type II toxin-antitoxin system RelE/ParE family toxin, partial [Pseudoxanthomonas sp.]
MSNASTRADTRAEPRIDRLQPWFAALLSALLHVLMLLVLLYSSRPTFSTPQGAASGGRTRVDFLGKTLEPPAPAPPTERVDPRAQPKPKPAKTPPAASRVQSTLSRQAENPLPPEPGDATANTVAPQPEAQPPAASPPAATPRRPQPFGRPPGMLAQDTAPDDAALDGGPATDQGTGVDANAAEPSLELGGYLV